MADRGIRWDTHDVTSVLLVDDDPDQRLFLRHSLSGEGFEIVGEATNGLDGIDQAGRLQPDLIVLDLTMPVVGGLMVCRSLRRWHLAPLWWCSRLRRTPRYVAVR